VKFNSVLANYLYLSFVRKHSKQYQTQECTGKKISFKSGFVLYVHRPSNFMFNFSPALLVLVPVGA